MNSFLAANRSRQQQQQQQQQRQSSSGNNNMASSSPQHPILTSEAVAALPPPGLSGPSSIMFSPRLPISLRGAATEQQQPISSGQFLAFVASSSMLTAQQPRRLDVKHSVLPVAAATTTATTTAASSAAPPNNATGGRSGSSSSSSSVSERQLFVLNVSELLAEQQQQQSKKGASTSRTSRKLSGPPQPHEPLPTYFDSPNSSLSNIAIYPLLRIPGSENASNSNNTSTANSKGKNGAKQQSAPPPSGGITTTSMLSASFPVGSRTHAAPQQEPPQQQSASSPSAASTPFPNITSSSLIQFSWCQCKNKNEAMSSTTARDSYDKSDGTSLIATTKSQLRLLVPIRGSLYVQHGILDESDPLQVVYDKANHNPSPRRSLKTNNTTNHNTTDAEDPHMSPDGRMVAFIVAGEIFVVPCDKYNGTTSSNNMMSDDAACVQITFGATDAISHGVADFIAQEEMDRYRGFWWHPDSNGILFTRLDESNVPNYRILHQDVGSNVGPPTTTHLGAMSSSEAGSGGEGTNSSGNSSMPNAPSSAATYEDHRYPFAGNANPTVVLGFVKVNYDTYFDGSASSDERRDEAEDTSAESTAKEEWGRIRWYESPREAPEYMTRVIWLPDGTACAQWQNRTQNTLVMTRMDVQNAQRARTMLVERTQYWINLHHMMKPLPWAIHPDDCVGTVDNIPTLPNPLPDGSFSFLFASERTGYCHLYLYTQVPGYNGDQAVLLKSVSGDGDWMVESIVGVDMKRDLVYCMGTYDSVLERHLYALPIRNQRKCHQGGSDAGDHHPSDEVDTNSNSNTNPHHTRSNSGNHGVRRGLKQVMNALSGKNRTRNNSVTGSGLGPSSSDNTPPPHRLTVEAGMHNVVMDEDCTVFVDTSSDLDRPTTVQVFALQHADDINAGDDTATAASHGNGEQFVKVQFLLTLYNALHDEKTMTALNLTTTSSASSSANNGPTGKPHRLISSLPAPELLSFPTSDGSETLHAALYRPDPMKHGHGPYPLVCAVYGGPHVQRVNRSWSQCADMRAQRLCSLGFCVVKCDNRGSSRRGMAFESSIARRLGRLEVLDQVAAVRQMTLRGIADPTRVGIYGWSYGGYLSAMCLCRAPDVFHVAVAGAPVTSWDGYDTHYTERYMGLPSDNVSGYRESAVFDHVPNMRGRLMLVHGLIDENVHFRHTARLINRLIGAGKDYDLLIFPDERHSPRRLRDRIYMEQRISDYFVRHLGSPAIGGAAGNGGMAVRSVPGHL